MRTACLAGLAGFAITAASIAVAQPAGPRSVTRAEVSNRVSEAFARVDTNRDGAVTRAEADAAFAARRGERRAQMFDRLDANKDGQISRQEFTARGERRIGEGRPGMGKGGMGMGRMGFGGRMFAMADGNRDGRISLQEATASALRHFDMVDANRDGTVTPDERRQMRGMHSPQHRHPTS